MTDEQIDTLWQAQVLLSDQIKAMSERVAGLGEKGRALDERLTLINDELGRSKAELSNRLIYMSKRIDALVRQVNFGAPPPFEPSPGPEAEDPMFRGATYYALIDRLGVLCVDRVGDGEECCTADDAAKLADTYGDSIYFTV